MRAPSSTEVGSRRPHVLVTGTTHSGTTWVGQAGLLWRVLVDAVLGSRRRHPDWLFIRKENLTSDPEAGFRAVCEHVNLQDMGKISVTEALSTQVEWPTCRPRNDSPATGQNHC